MSFSDRRRERKARRLARVLVALDDAARERRSSVPSRRRVSVGTSR